MNQYCIKEGSKLGEGTYGTVVKGKEKATGKDVAVKRAKLEICVEEGIPCTVVREISLLQTLNGAGQHIVSLENHFFEEGDNLENILLIFERHECDLKKFADKCGNRFSGTKRGPMRPDMIKGIMKQLLQGLNQLHKSGMVHRDLKPQNILVSSKPHSKPVVRIADMGLGRNPTFQPMKEYTHEIMTLWYRAPEVLLGGNYGFQVDMWSIGCIFAELYQGKPLFYADCEFHQLIKIFEMMGLPSEDTFPGVTHLPYWHEYPNFKSGKLDALMIECMNSDAVAVDLLKKMLLYDPSKRINARDALNHPYFDDL